MVIHYQKLKSAYVYIFATLAVILLASSFFYFPAKNQTTIFDHVQVNFNSNNTVLDMYIQLQKKYLIDNELLYIPDTTSAKYCFITVGTNFLSTIKPDTDLATFDYGTVQAYYMLAYCIHHGYSYQYLVLQPPKDRFAGWLKVLVLPDILMQFPYVIVTDRDAFLTVFDLRLEYLLDRWGFNKPQNVFAAALDPPNEQENFFKGWDGTIRNNINTGFMIWKNSSRAHELLNMLNSCDTDKCKHFYWKDWPEQGLINVFIRPVLKENELVTLDCSEANGAFNFKYHDKDKHIDKNFTGCDTALFVTHRWLSKTVVSKEVAVALLRGLYGMRKYVEN